MEELTPFHFNPPQPTLILVKHHIFWYNSGSPKPLMGNQVRHLLNILISILILSSPVIGDNHKGETLYRWGNTLPYVWKGFGDKETQPKYQGQVKDGKPNGSWCFDFN